MRTRARNLPIHRCYINQDWEESQQAMILIFRKHTHGNITFGRFLVDLKLYGVKECSYKFNESPYMMEEMLEELGKHWVESDYNLVHNIIYAALEFAEEYGFSPHKNFKIAKYMLQEDNDDIPLMNVPLGDNGVPTLVVPYGETGQREMAILNKTAGENYRVVFLDEDGNPEPEERTYVEIFDEIIKIGLDAYAEKHDGKPESAMEKQAVMDFLYLIKVYTVEDREQIGRTFDQIVRDPRTTMKSDNIENHEEELVQHLLEEATGRVDDDAVKDAYSRLPDHPVIKAWYAEWLAQKGHADEVFALFENRPGLDALTTENRYISNRAIPFFCNAYAMAWLQRGDLLHVEPYYQLIVRMNLDDPIGKNIQNTVAKLKRKKLEEMFDAGMFNGAKTDAQAGNETPTE